VARETNQKEKEDKKSRIGLLPPKGGNVCVSVCIGVSSCRLPSVKRCRETRCRSRWKSVCQKWIRHIRPSAIWRDNFDSVHGDNLRRRNYRGKLVPAPEWLAKIGSSFLPGRTIRLVRARDLFCNSLDFLLCNKAQGIRNVKRSVHRESDLAKYDIWPVPCGEDNSSMGAKGAPIARRTIPIVVRQAVNARYLEI
jgi:hypothetical protein